MKGKEAKKEKKKEKASTGKTKELSEYQKEKGRKQSSILDAKTK